MNSKALPNSSFFFQDPNFGSFRVEHDAAGCVHAVEPGAHPPSDVLTPAETRLLATIRESLRGSSAPFSVPLFLNGTPFQQEVWKTLMRIPRGETISYKKLAALVGNPRGQRAVAAAAAANVIAFLVPCHRLVASDGIAGGFRWGADVKQAWLDLEQHPVG